MCVWPCMARLHPQYYLNISKSFVPIIGFYSKPSKNPSFAIKGVKRLGNEITTLIQHHVLIIRLWDLKYRSLNNKERFFFKKKIIQFICLIFSTNIWNQYLSGLSLRQLAYGPPTVTYCSNASINFPHSFHRKTCWIETKWASEVAFHWDFYWSPMTGKNHLILL